jgi:hypothetical protein
LGLLHQSIDIFLVGFIAAVAGLLRAPALFRKGLDLLHGAALEQASDDVPVPELVPGRALSLERIGVPVGLPLPLLLLELFVGFGNERGENLEFCLKTFNYYFHDCLQKNVTGFRILNRPQTLRRFENLVAHESHYAH